MRPLASLLVLVLVAGCSSPEPQPAPAPPPPQPAAPPPPAEIAAPPADDGAIVIKGSKDDEPSANPTRNADDQEKIDALQAQALASQGQDNGKPYRERAGGAAAPGKAAPVRGKSGKKGQGSFAPALTVSWVSGTGADPTAASGQVIVVEFWSPANRPSRSSLASLQALVNNYAGGVAVDAIALRDGGNQAANIASAEGVTYGVGVDQNGQTALDYGVSGAPTFVLVDKKGIIRGKGRGIPSKAAVDALVKE